ncbi:hypothetical protein JMUB6875_12390 [Nocardia sp. JMUB6875]|uniref:hypothetical protein n=1 Tax=Nocardia sp. JMUB6875 TaxID=3158170 RepID=UPI0032E7C5A5
MARFAVADHACGVAAGRRTGPRRRLDLLPLCVLGYGDERPLASVEAFRDAVGRYAQLGISRLAILWPRGDGAAAAMGVLEQAAAEVSG